MPVYERRGRARLRSRPETDIQSLAELREVLASTQDAPDAWMEARPRVVRFLAQRVGDADRALAIAETYHTRPELLPMRPPAEA